MTRDDWRQSVPDAETFDQLFDRARRKSEVPAAPRLGVGAVRVAPRPTPRSAPRPQARVVINADRALGAPEKAPDEPRAAPVTLRFGAPPAAPSPGPAAQVAAPALPPGIESFADLLDEEPPRPQAARPALTAASPAPPPAAPRFAAPPLPPPVAMAAPLPAVRFGPPPPEPARPRIDTLPPPRRPLVTLPFLQKRSLTTGGSIAVSALTAGVVAGLAIAFHAWRQPAPLIVATSTRDALMPAAVAPPTAMAPSAASTVPAAAAPPPRIAEQAAAPAPGELPPGYGRLTVQSARDADVYLTGKRAGPANGPLDVRCGTWFVRLARPGEDFPPEWIGAGETVRVACQAATTVELGPAQSSTLVLKRPAR